MSKNYGNKSKFNSINSYAKYIYARKRHYTKCSLTYTLLFHQIFLMHILPIKNKQYIRENCLLKQIKTKLNKANLPSTHCTINQFITKQKKKE